MAIPTALAQRAGAAHSAGFGGVTQPHRTALAAFPFFHQPPRLRLAASPRARMTFTRPVAPFHSHTAHVRSEPSSDTRCRHGVTGLPIAAIRITALSVLRNSWELLPGPRLSGFTDTHNVDSGSYDPDRTRQEPASLKRRRLSSGYVIPRIRVLPQSLRPFRQSQSYPHFQRRSSRRNPELRPHLRHSNRPRSGSIGRQQSVPLADLNLPATEQAAQQAGLTFRRQHKVSNRRSGLKLRESANPPQRWFICRVDSFENCIHDAARAYSSRSPHPFTQS